MNRSLLFIALSLAGIVAIVLLLRQSSGTLPSVGGDRFAYVLYMGIWGSLVGAAVISRPEGIGRSLVQLVIWIGIFLVLMTGYSYRYELQDVASRVTGGLVPGSPISVTSKDGRNQITLIRDSNGHFKANGNINGASISFLVDTGASELVLSNSDAQRAGIDTNTLRYNVPVSTANGITSSAKTRINTLSIGPLIFDNISVMISRPGDLDESLLGMRVINQLASFEIRGDRMILTD